MNNFHLHHTMNAHHSTWLVVLLTALGLAACAPFIAKEDPTQYYVLKAKSSGRLSSSPKIAVGVGPTTVPGYLERDEIATAGPASGLKLAEYHVWAEPLDKAVPHVVARNMSRLLNSPAVVPFPDADTKIDYQTGIVIRRFEMGPDNQVHLEASYFVEGAPEADLSQVTRPRSLPLLTPYETSRGTRHVWTTFSADQVDLNFAEPTVLAEFIDILLFSV